MSLRRRTFFRSALGSAFPCTVVLSPVPAQSSGPPYFSDVRGVTRNARLDMPVSQAFYGINSRIKDPGAARIVSPQQWRNIWIKNFGTETAQPTVDFDKHMVIAVFTGRDAGHGLSVESIIRQTNQLTITTQDEHTHVLMMGASNYLFSF
jgi:hypothetical protein